jgi:Uma2 family endonuclease
VPTAERVDLVTVDEYLVAEEGSDIRHEYLGGLVYAMAGTTREHNRIVGNLYKNIDRHLGSGPCKLFMTDIRVNFDILHDEYFYYPDLVVTCEPRDNDPRFVRQPKLIIEVLSPGTERVDRREKFFAYQNIHSLEEYVLIGQESKEATVFRRADGWGSQKISGPDASVNFASLAFTLPIAAIYEGV